MILKYCAQEHNTTMPVARAGRNNNKINVETLTQTLRSRDKGVYKVPCLFWEIMNVSQRVFTNCYLFKRASPVFLALSDANGPPTGHTAVARKPSAYVAHTCYVTQNKQKNILVCNIFTVVGEIYLGFLNNNYKCNINTNIRQCIYTCTCTL